MSRRMWVLLGGFAVLVLMASPSWARNNSATLSATIDVDSTTSINNTTLGPGEYKVVAEGNQARFEKDGKVVAEAPCTLKTLPSKASYTEVVTDRDQLKEIQVSGKMQAIEFSSN